ncbi:MAG: hypothetical protein JNL62_16435 [Bryobacterales bacterium]|nr:hypothetical protein [Bryobacterales bacterium]
MVIEDARPAVDAAVEILLKYRKAQGLPKLTIESMPAFLERAAKDELKLEEKLLLLDQATFILEEFYAHLHFKRARYAVDPIQRLRLLRDDVEQLTDMEFHSEMVKTFSRLRDPHTFYALPKPFSGASAFLPFRMQHYCVDRIKHFLVTEVMNGFIHPTFTPGAHVTHYNGMPMEEAVWRETGLDSAGNEAAQFIRGLNSLFGRALDNTAPREDHYALLQYNPAPPNDNEERGILLPWQVMTGLRLPSSSGGSRSSIFTSQLQTNECRKALWEWGQLEEEKQADETYGRGSAAVKPPDRKPNETRFPALFSFTASGFHKEATAAGVRPSTLCDGKRYDCQYGYLRIHSFNVARAADFLDEAKRILTLLNDTAGDGLVLDIRSNPGGSIEAAEGLLQMLTPREIQTSQFHFMNSRATRNIALQLSKPVEFDRTAAVQQFDEWREGLLASLAEGSVLTPGRPLTRVENANDTGQVYQGPVVLLIDALSYSAADIFAAGFEDNEIGPILGVDRNTGGGGANRWLHHELRENTEKISNIPLRVLPGGANFGIAIRRTTRVGKNLGGALEDVGVQCGEGLLHRRTLSDLLDGDRQLIEKACMLLSEHPTYWLKIEQASVKEDGVHVLMQTIGIDRIECYLDGFPQFTIAVTRDPEAEAANRIEGMGIEAVISTEALVRPPSRLKVKGYTRIDNEDELAMRLVAANDFLFE